MSESIPAGRLAMIPTSVDDAATIPIIDSEAPRLFVNKGSTGFFDIVELNIASIPVPHSNINDDKNLIF